MVPYDHLLVFEDLCRALSREGPSINLERQGHRYAGRDPLHRSRAIFGGQRNRWAGRNRIKRDAARRIPTNPSVFQAKRRSRKPCSLGPQEMTGSRWGRIIRYQLAAKTRPPNSGALRTEWPDRRRHLGVLLPQQGTDHRLNDGPFDVRQSAIWRRVDRPVALRFTEGLVGAGIQSEHLREKTSAAGRSRRPAGSPLGKPVGSPQRGSVEGRLLDASRFRSGSVNA